jgi:hypothetical protein
MQTFKKLPTAAPKMKAKKFNNIFLFSYLNYLKNGGIGAGLLDIFEIARQFCRLIPLVYQDLGQ